MASFSDLSFKEKSGGFGVQAVIFYPNGYGASVIQGPYTYGGPQGLYELAVLKGDKTKYDLCYDTHITSDVEGHLTAADVSRLLTEVEALDPA